MCVCVGGGGDGGYARQIVPEGSDWYSFIDTKFSFSSVKSVRG